MVGLEFGVSGKQNESLPQHLRHSTFLGSVSKSISRCNQEKDEAFCSPKSYKYIDLQHQLKHPIYFKALNLEPIEHSHRDFTNINNHNFKNKFSFICLGCIWLKYKLKMKANYELESTGNKFPCQKYQVFAKTSF